MQMNFLNRFRIETRILAGYGVVLALLLGLGGVALWRLGEIESQTNYLAADLAHDQVLADTIDSRLMAVRLYATRYLRTHTTADREQIATEMQALDAALAAAPAALTEPVFAPLLQQLVSDEARYDAALEELLTVVDGRLAGWAEAQAAQAPLVESQLAALRQQAVARGTAAQVAAAGQALEQFARLRLAAAERLGGSADAAAAQTAGQAALAALEAFQAAAPAEERALAQQAALDLAGYRAAVDRMWQARDREDSLVADTLNPAGVAIRAGADRLTTAVQAEFDATEAAGNQLVADTQVLLWVVMLVAVVSAGALGVLNARGITRPLAEVVRAAEGIAAGELDQRVNVYGRDEIGQLAGAFRRMIAYLEGMAGAATRIAAGDLTENLKPLSERDRLGLAFAEMTANLRQLIGRLSQNAAAVRAAADSLTETTAQADQATEQISMTMQQVARGTHQQSEGITHTAASMEEMRRAIEGVAKGAQEQAQAVAQTSGAMNQLAEAVAGIRAGAGAQAGTLERAETAQLSLGQSLETVGAATQAVAAAARQSAETAQEGSRLAADSVAGMGRVRQATEQLASRVRDLGKRTGQIGAIIATIDDIAAQTNLLALNAAIEAARAGQYGKGFAVVADEVRKLAERSAQATKEITAMIQMVQAGAGEVVEAMQATGTDVSTAANATQTAGTAFTAIAAETRQLQEQVRAIEAAVADMGQADQALRAAVRAAGQTAGANQAATDSMNELNNRVVGSLDSVSAVVEENTAATEQMAASAQEVLQSIENIASVSEENSAAAEEVSASTEEMHAQVAEVGRAAQALAELAQGLTGLVQQFQLAAEAPPGPAAFARPAAAPAGYNGAGGYHGAGGRAEGAGAGPAATAVAPRVAVSAAALAWDDSLATGEPKVDQQHRELIRQINALIKAMTEGHGRQEVEPILDFLSVYVNQHFSWEEGCMEKHHCPVAAVNKQAHTRFVEKFQRLRDRFYREGASTDLVLEVRQELGDWLVNHIRKIDTNLRGCVGGQHRAN